MSQDEGAKHKRICMEKAVELLFNDSSKNFSDLKSRQWTATNLSVVAIMALAALTREPTPAISRPIASVLMVLIVVCHEVVTAKCSTNLEIFRARIKTLISCHFTEESHGLFKEGKEGGRFEDALVDEGRISLILFLSTPVTLLFALAVVWRPSLCLIFR